MRVFLTGGLFMVSACTRLPLFKLLAQVFTVTAPDARRSVILEALNHPSLHRAFVAASLLTGGGDVVLAIINTAYNFVHVTAAFGTQDFNAQVAHANTVMRLPGMALGLLTYAGSLMRIEKQLEANYGHEVSLLQPDTLYKKLRPAEGTAASHAG